MLVLIYISSIIKNLITVFEQTNTNIHILDLVNVYNTSIDNYHLDSGFYNAVFENVHC